MAMEALFLVLGVVGLIPITPFSPWIGIILVFIALLSVAAKIVKMKPALSRLNEAQISHPLLRLMAFTYGTKWYWLRGYFAGLRRGKEHCLECRRRLQEMTPKLYRGNLLNIKS